VSSWISITTSLQTAVSILRLLLRATPAGITVAYKEQLRREFLCGLLTVDDAVRVGIAALGAARECPCSILRPARRGSRLEKDEQQG